MPPRGTDERIPDGGTEPLAAGDDECMLTAMIPCCDDLTGRVVAAPTFRKQHGKLASQAPFLDGAAGRKTKPSHLAVAQHTRAQSRLSEIPL